MTSLPALFFAAALLTGVLALIALWSRRGIGVKASVLGFAFALFSILYVSLLDLLARPKPTHMEWVQAAEATVLGALPVGGEAIYLWLSLPGATEPRYYVLPWSRTVAEQLQEAREKAGEAGQVKMRLPFEPSLEDREPMFYAEPQPALPPKEVPSVPQIFEGE